MSRRGARIARKLEKALQEKEKSARLVSTFAESVSRKKPRLSKNPDSIFSMFVTWDADNPDKVDEWSWGVARSCILDEWDSEILPKLKEWEKKTWGEVDLLSSDSGHKMHHTHKTDDICDEAISRMNEIERAEEVVFRFRLGNLKRLWGFRRAEHFEILWYDPTHKIYPTEQT